MTAICGDRPLDLECYRALRSYYLPSMHLLVPHQLTFAPGHDPREPGGADETVRANLKSDVCSTSGWGVGSGQNQGRRGGGL